MKNITLDEFNLLALQTDDLMQSLIKLKVNHGVLITKKEWKRKSPPNAYLRFKLPTMSFKTQTFQNAYAILKVK